MNKLAKKTSFCSISCVISWQNSVKYIIWTFFVWNSEYWTKNFFCNSEHWFIERKYGKPKRNYSPNAPLDPHLQTTKILSSDPSSTGWQSLHWKCVCQGWKENDNPSWKSKAKNSQFEEIVLCHGHQNQCESFKETFIYFMLRDIQQERDGAILLCNIQGVPKKIELRF